MKKIFIAGAGLTIATLAFLPKFLNLIGLHPYYEGEKFNLPNKRALIVTTSHSLLGESGKKTGVYASEMTVPYYEFIESNIKVDIASINGGKIPIEASSLRYPLATPEDKKFLKDKTFKGKVENSFKIDEVDFTNYDLIFLAGGWGASYDLGMSTVLGEKITQANQAGILIGSVCHGVLGLIKAKEVDGAPLLKDKIITGVSNKQLRELKITGTPMHPETEVRKQGAKFTSKTAFKDFLATLTIIDGNIVTGQNQNSGRETAQTMMGLLQMKI